MAALNLDPIGILMQDSPSGKFYYLNGNGAFTEFVIPTASQNGYLSYVALLTQTGTDAPVATVLENTISGSIVWTYTAEGVYTGTLTGAFTENKTYLNINPIGDSASGYICGVTRTGSNTVLVTTSSVATLLGADSVLDNISIEIRVYP